MAEESEERVDVCPRCKSEELVVSNIDGYICEECGCWFDCDEEGRTIWAYDHLPEQV